MCDHGCSRGVDCTHVREGDTWIVSDRPASTETARPATETRRTATQAPTDPPSRERAPTCPPALTAAAFEAAMRRDGGEFYSP